MKVGNTQITLNVDFLAPALIDFTTDTIEVAVEASSTSSFSIHYPGISITSNATSTGLNGANSTNGVTFPTTSSSQTIA